MLRDAAQRIPFGLPCGEAAVQHRHSGVTEPAKQPPGACGVSAVAGVVRDHLSVGIDTPLSERGRERVRVRQRVPPGYTGNQRAREVRCEIGEQCARDMAGRVGGGTGHRIGERCAAVDHAPAGIFELFEQNF